ncbi:prephenate dehydrogenase [Tindallia magadiensis]|uniref:Prephenate dehydrogenase n=1 Tax=Tindallia magadiensis TaxID=69895 RepID=A0A1I3DNW8_9FIRM|nr:prephenate dehydrogenase [Tindallia magadiensis]SFH88444.1 prephenate dehydrogenase [Tindallia magadiensis]
MHDFNKIALIGVGLMGGSFALALKEKGISCQITGFDIQKKALEDAIRLSAIDSMSKTITDAVIEADLVVLGTPVGHYDAIIREMLPALKKGAIVTDLGSVKEAAVKSAQNLPSHIQFIGGHPLAGSEKGGIEAASPYLFENAYYFLTPALHTESRAVDKMKSLVSRIGGFPIIMTPEEHDSIVAKTSHLPHLMASVLTCMMENEKDEALKNFAGSGFRDTTRIASGNPVMWEEIFYYNEKELLKSMDRLDCMLKRFQHAMISSNRDEIRRLLEIGKNYRDQLPQTGKDYIPKRYELFVDIKDEPGALAHITGTIGSAEVNIKEIEIVHSREGEKGAVRLAFAKKEEEARAMQALGKEGVSFSRQKGEINDVNGT